MKESKTDNKLIKGIRRNNKQIFIKKIIISIVILIIVLFIGLFSIKMISNNTKVITINGENYNKSDFMIYLYSVKYNYFGSDNTDVSTDDLNTIYDETTNQSVKEHLKDLVLSELKTSSAIKKLADDNNIIITETDKKEIQKEKSIFIKKLGGNKKFKKFLNHNKTTEKSYDKMSETDKLYKKIIKSLYSKNKINDLTKEELNQGKENYKNHYIKIKQIILTIVDPTTRKTLSSTTINQKEALANAIIEKANSGIEFDELIKKYSEDAVEKEPPYDFYYKKGELLTEIENVALELNPGDVSKVIKTKYAYHIIQKQELDDSKLDDYYDELREEKCLKDLKEYLNNLKIVYQKSYNKIKIK